MNCIESFEKNWQQIKEQFGDKRRTVILDTHEDLSHEDLITEQDLVVTLISRRLY